MAKGKRKRAKAGQQPGSGRRKRHRQGSGVLALVRGARREAARALARLRGEIEGARKTLESLLAEERSFLSELTGKTLAGAQKVVAPMGRQRRRGAARRRGPTKADAFFAKLPQRFTLDDVRKMAGRLAGVSLAQWSRAKKIEKRKGSYTKVGSNAA